MVLSSLNLYTRIEYDPKKSEAAAPRSSLAPHPVPEGSPGGQKQSTTKACKILLFSVRKIINRNLLLLHFLYIKFSYELSWDFDPIYKNFLISFQFSAILEKFQNFFDDL